MTADPLQDALNSAQKTPAEWYPRTKDPPPGVVWATDGVLVWPIYTDGKIPANAALVRAWTNAFIPQPPRPEDLPR